MKRKLDYFFTPYNGTINTDKYMNFNTKFDDQNIYTFDKNGRLSDEFHNPYTHGIAKTNAIWRKIKAKVFDTDAAVFKAVRQRVRLMDPTEDYLTKMDLIDSHPELYYLSGPNT